MKELQERILKEGRILPGNILKADCGPVTVTCIADTKMYIDNIAADLRALIS